MPTDSDLLHYYQGFAFEKPSRGDVEHDAPLVQASLRHFIGAPTGEGRRFLDYGGGFGIYCRAAQELGWEPWLLDYDRSCLDYAKSEMGAVQVVASLEELRGTSFDVIWGFHVIEHWNCIDRNIEALIALLAPGGRLVFATPNAHSFEKWVRPYHLRNYTRSLVSKGESWGRAISLTFRPRSFLCWDPPRHLFAFTRSALVAVGRRHGLDAKIELGFNTAVRYEPRQYVVPNPFAPRFKAPQGATKITSFLRRILACFSWLACEGLRMCFPQRGEQLYVTYCRCKPRSSSLSS
jgi:SAM-dependent methyltransferase